MQSSARNIFLRSLVSSRWQYCQHSKEQRNFIMKLGKLSVLSAAALLAGGISLALAQSNPAPRGSTGAANPEGQCWDQASNTVKDKAGSASGAKTPGGLTTGSSQS